MPPERPFARCSLHLSGDVGAADVARRFVGSILEVWGVPIDVIDDVRVVAGSVVRSDGVPGAPVVVTLTRHGESAEMVVEPIGALESDTVDLVEGLFPAVRHYPAHSLCISIGWPT